MAWMTTNAVLFSVYVYRNTMILIFNGKKIILIKKLVELSRLNVLTEGQKTTIQWFTWLLNILRFQHKKKNEILRSMTMMASQTNEICICLIRFISKFHSKKSIDCRLHHTTIESKLFVALELEMLWKQMCADFESDWQELN